MIYWVFQFDTSFTNEMYFGSGNCCDFSVKSENKGELSSHSSRRFVTKGLMAVTQRDLNNGKCLGFL